MKKRKQFAPPLATGVGAAVAAAPPPSTLPAVRRPFKLPSLVPVALPPATAPTSAAENAQPAVTPPAGTIQPKPRLVLPGLRKRKAVSVAAAGSTAGKPAAPTQAAQQLGAQADRPEAVVPAAAPLESAQPAPVATTTIELARPHQHPVPPSLSTTVGWRVQRLPAVLPESLAPTAAAGGQLPPAASLLSHLPLLPVPATALLPLSHPGLGCLSAAAQRLEEGVQGLPLPASVLQGATSTATAAMTAAGGRAQLLAAALGQHPQRQQHPQPAHWKDPGSAVQGLLRLLHRLLPGSKVHIAAAAATAAASVPPPPPTAAIPVGHLSRKQAKLTPGGGAAAGAGAPPGFEPACTWRRPSATSAPTAAAGAGSIAAAAAIVACPVPMPGPLLPAEEAAVRRQLVEAHCIPLSRLRVLLAGS